MCFFLIPTSNLTTDQAQALYGQEVATADPPFATTSTNDLTRWISDTCGAVAPEQWRSAPHVSEM